MVEYDTEKGSGGKHWIDRTESAILDASAKVAGEQIVKDSIVLQKNMLDSSCPSKALKRSRRSNVGSAPFLIR